MTASQGLGAGVVRRVRRRAGTLAYLARLGRLSPDWPAIARSKLTQTAPARPVRLRDGTVLHHGRLDDPLLMLHEVWVQELYRLPAPPAPGRAAMIDAGANIGAVSLYWLARAPALRVHAYEPNPRALDTLRRNADANAVGERLTVHPEGLGRGPGALDLWVGGPSHEATGYRSEPPTAGARRVTVPLVGLDEAWDRLDRAPVWLLKVDTEGAEADILEGASPTTLAAVRHAIVECHDDILPGATARCRTALTVAGLTITRTISCAPDQTLLYATRPT